MPNTDTKGKSKSKVPPKGKAKGGKSKDLGKLTKGKKYGVGPIQLTPFEWGAVALGAYFIYAHFIRPANAATSTTDNTGATPDLSGSNLGTGAGSGGGSGGGSSGGTGGGSVNKGHKCGPGTHLANGRCVPTAHVCPPGYVLGPKGLHCVKAPKSKPVPPKHVPPGPPPVRHPNPTGGRPSGPPHHPAPHSVRHKPPVGVR